MAKKPEILIHTALFSEAKPIIAHFGLRQYETRPFKIFRGGNIVLIVSGVGGDNTSKALNLIYSQDKFKKALNIGTAGCSDTDTAIGSVFCPRGSLDGIPRLPLKTFDEPVVHLEATGTCLVDMEAGYFADVSEQYVPGDEIYIIKAVSDYLDDTIAGSTEIEQLIAAAIPYWEYLTDFYTEKMNAVIGQTAFNNLNAVDRGAIKKAALTYHFSHQELKQIIEMSLDFIIWDEQPVSQFLNIEFPSRKEAFRAVRKTWEDLKNSPKTYEGFTGTSDIGTSGKKQTLPLNRDVPGFGRCPVASPRTRCCNLLTLDAVEGCGFDCSYCSIRYFYDGETIGIDEDFVTKLKSLELDSDRIYHIGTGQSSDSLMWGNKSGILDAVLDFASDNSNVILELKTKSDNIGYLLKQEVPANVIVTWSLNTEAVTDNEEHFTASLERRLDAASGMAEKGCLVGFHFHPMVHYDNWKRDYGSLFSEIRRRFRPEDIAMISFGTLTFIKPVLKNLRERKMKSRILQMQLEDAEGKYSYSREIKREMFHFAYESFSDWHDNVFFYLCMEDADLWPEVFGFDYSDNEEFEAAMIGHYGGKVREKRRTYR